jgi:flagellar capping protein FliD
MSYSAQRYFMGTISSSITNTPVTTAGSSSSTFKGSSAYSSDFQNIIDRSVAIATLPISLLSNQQAALTSQSKELTALDTKFAALQDAVKKIGTALSGSSFKSEVSTENTVDISVSDGAREGVYSINVKSIGAYESSLSARNWNVPETVPGKPNTFTLVIGNQNYSVTGADNSAKSVVDAINSKYGNLVQATTVNVASGDTRISLKSATLGHTALDILQVPSDSAASDLQQQAPAGYVTSRTSATWDASGSQAATYTLVVGTDRHDFTPASNSAVDVASEINRQYGSQVRATVVNLGSSTTPDLRVSLQSVTAGAFNGSTVLDLRKSGGEPLQTKQFAAISRTSAAWNGAADPEGSRSTYNLVVGTTQYSFTPSDNSAASVVDAINSLYGSQVQASLVDFGTSENPDLRISMQTSAGSSTTLDLQKVTAASFQNEQTEGTLASYEMNSSGVTSTSKTRSITISDGVTATLKGISGAAASSTIPVDITVTRSTSAVDAALTAFTGAYNAAIDEVDTQRGQSAGALGGQQVISQLASLLSSISTFSTDGQVNGLKAIGVDLQTNGHLTYTSFQFMAADIMSSISVTSFLGSSTGGGFLKNATDALNRIEDSTTGLLKTSATDLNSQITRITETIAKKQSQVDALQIRLQNQMAISDALIAAMEQKSSYFSSMFAAQQTANQMYQ